MKTLLRYSWYWLCGQLMLVALWALLFALCGTSFGQSVTFSPTTLLNGSTAQTVTVTGFNSSWTAGTPGVPAFSVLKGGCTITAQTVNTASTATLTMNAGATNGQCILKVPGVLASDNPAEGLLTIAPNLTIGQPFIVNGTTGNVVSLSGVTTTWNTSAPTFSISGCATATKTAQAITNNTSATITLSAGGTDCTITITDSSTSATATIAVRTTRHWFIRTDGGTRYSTNYTSGQCDGLGDAPYPGTGVNQHCAFNDYRYLYQDGTYANGTAFPAWGWVIGGGDTVTIRGSIGTGVSWRVGAAPPSQTTYCVGNTYPCWGLAGDSTDSENPPIPAGIASQHTIIQGENAGACTSQTARTQLHGGSTLYFVLNLKSTSYVDADCLDITDFSNCSTPAGTCTGTQDFASNGIWLYADDSNITLNDIRVHGLGYSGIGGPPGPGFVANDLAIVGNAGAGWNADPGDGTTGFGSLNVTGFDVSWNGCAEEYPITDSLPYAYCRDDNTGGYGDGFGTTTVASPSPGWQVHFDQGTTSYNTQDGLDALHIGGQGSTMTDTRVLAYGNMGQQLKIGGSVSTIQNSQIVGNCTALQQTIPGRPVPTNDNLSDFCRAANVAVAIGLVPGSPAKFQANTLYSNNATAIEVDYSYTSGSTNTLLFNNNVFLGFANAGTNPQPIGGTAVAALSNPGASYTNNATFGQKSGLPCPETGETAAICTDPKLTDETYHLYGYGDMVPLTGSPTIGAGVALGGVTVDYNGTSRANPPTIGAFEKSAAPAIPVGGGTINGRVANLIITCPEVSEDEVDCPTCLVFSPSTCSIKVVYK